MKTFFLAIVFLFGTMCLAAQSQGTPLSPMIMGQSYHYTDWNDAAGNNQVPLDPQNVWPKVTESGTKLVRVGGKQYNIGAERPTSGQEVYYVSIIDDIRSHGCEPVLTLPFLHARTGTATPEANVNDPNGHFATDLASSISTLQAILHYVNGIHKRNVRMIILGNEPDLDYKWSKKSPYNLTAAQIASNIAGYIKPMADAVRQMSATIGPVKIIGPEYTHCLPEVYDLLFTPSITATYIGGKSPVTKQPYLDYASVHLYGPEYEDPTPDPLSYSPSFSAGTVWTASLTFCNIERYAKDWVEPTDVARRYRGAMHYMKRKVAESTTHRSGYAPLGWIVTEMNSGHTLTNSGGTNASSDANGHDGLSVQGAQNLARMYALAMEYGAESVMMWSVKESASHQDRGYLVGAAANPADVGKKRPTWFHYKMLADYFKGTYYRDEVMANHVSNSSSSGSGTTIDGFDINPNSSYSSPDETRGPEWLHFKSGTSQTIALGSSTFALGTGPAFTAHLEKMCETKAFAAKGADIAVMILNHSANTQTAVIKFSKVTSVSGFTTAGAANFKCFSFDMGNPTELVCSQTGTNAGWDAAIGPHSTHVIILDCSGGSVKKRFRFRLSDEAINYSDPFEEFYGPANIFSIVALPSNTCLLPSAGAAISVTGAPAGSTYLWYKFPSTLPISAVSGSILSAANYPSIAPGLYKAAVNNGSFCSTVTVATVLHLASPLVDAGEGAEFCAASSTAVLGSTLLATSAYGNYTYTWQPYGVQNATMAVSNSTLPSSTMFTLYATGGGCTYTDQAWVEVKNPVSIYMKDHNNDLGAVPTSTSPAWISPDIWANYTPGTAPGDAYIQPNTTVFVKVRVRNNGCNAIAAGSTSVSLYYSLAAPVGNWMGAWSNYTCSLAMPNLCANQPTNMCGDLIGTTTTPSMASGSSAVVEFTWNAPPSHTCGYSGPKSAFMNFYFDNWVLLALASHSQDTYTTSTSNVLQNVISENNIAARIIVYHYASTLSVMAPSGIYIFNDQNDVATRLDFIARRDYNNENVLDYADAIMYFPNDFLQPWIDAGQEGEGIVLLSDTSVQIVADHAYMDGIPFGASHVIPTGLSVAPRMDVDYSGGAYFELDVIQSPPGYTDSIMGGLTYRILKDQWDCEDCEGGEGLRQAYTASLVQDDSVHFISNLTVPNGQTYQYERSVLRFAGNTKITVEAGGKLILKNCRLEAACRHQKWSGIEIIGTTGGFTAQASTFRDCETPIRALNSSGMVITKNAFIGTRSCLGSAVSLTNCSDWDISYNNIANFAEGISTRETFTSAINNRIERNVIQGTGVAIRSFKDNFMSTDIRCNTLRYHQHGIRSDSSQLRNFGSQLEGSGNRFRTKATHTNHKIYHLAGNSPTYYYSPALPDSTEISIAVSPAVDDRICFPGDSTGASSRIAYIVETAKTNFGITAVPNPANDRTTITATLGDYKSGVVLIRDAQGRLVARHEVSVANPRFDLRLSQMSRGLYFATLEVPEGERTHVKLLVQE